MFCEHVMGPRVPRRVQVATCTPTRRMCSLRCLSPHVPAPTSSGPGDSVSSPSVQDGGFARTFQLSGVWPLAPLDPVVLLLDCRVSYRPGWRAPCRPADACGLGFPGMFWGLCACLLCTLLSPYKAVRGPSGCLVQRAAFQENMIQFSFRSQTEASGSGS